MTGLSPFGNGSDERSRGTRSVPAVRIGRLGEPRASVLASSAIAAVCLLAAGSALLADGSLITVKLVLTVMTCGVLSMAVIAYHAPKAADSKVDSKVRLVRLVAKRGQAELQQMIDRLMRGEQPAPLVPAPATAAGDDQFLLLAAELEQSQYLAGQALLQVAGKVFGGRSDQRVEIFVNLARRMQSLVHREIELLDEIESKVEDPDLLTSLFAVDHLATRLRRQTESLAVLGGSPSRRQWTRQVAMHEVLRAGVAEVEHYSRVKVVSPVDGVLRSAAVTDVIHLVAELVENATKFSAPQTAVLLRAQQVLTGVAIEIEDRGLGMPPGDQQRLNDLLADPDQVDVDELLRDGRIGLYVVAALARRHGIRVRLRNGTHGGTQATVVLPAALLEPADDGALPYSAGSADQPQHASPLLATAPADGGPDKDAGYAVIRTAAPRSVAAGTDGQPHTDGPLPVAAQRPPLPRRRAQAAYSSQQRDHSSHQRDQHQRDQHRAERSDDSAACQGEPPAEQMPGLMADFLHGFGRAVEEDSAVRLTTPRTTGTLSEGESTHHGERYPKP